MSTASLVIDANQSGVAYTGDLNNALDAINTCHSGVSAPTNQVSSGKLWLDTSGSNPILRIYRNGWKELFTLKTASVELDINEIVTSTLEVETTSTFTGAITASGGISGNVSGNISGGTIAGTTGSFSSGISATTGTFSSNVSGANGSFSSGISSTTGSFSSGISATTGSFSSNVTANDFNSTSDKRLKTNILPLNNALDKVKKLEGVSFKINNESKIGVIAQDIQKVIPEVVNKKEDGYLSVSYGNIVGLLIEAIKEQQIKIDQLEQKLGDL
jgi:hypothetical protein